MANPTFQIDRQDSIPVSMSFFLHNQDVERFLSNVDDSKVLVSFCSDLTGHGIRLVTDILKRDVEYPLISLWWSVDYGEFRMLVYPIKKEYRSKVLDEFWIGFSAPMADWLNTSREEAWYSSERHVHLYYNTGSGLLKHVELENGSD